NGTRDLSSGQQGHRVSEYNLVGASDVKRKRAFKQLPDRITFRNGRHLYSQRCRDAILELDPEAGHQFIPADLTDANDERKIPPYYWVLSGRRMLAIDPPRGVRGIPHEKGWKQSRARYDHLLLTNERAEYSSSLPCWSETAGLALNYMTHELITAPRDRGLTGFEPFDPKLLADLWAQQKEPAGMIYGSVNTVTFEI
ncbi:MAG: hypothetical protein MK098_10980, partial [Marinovum sp.]|nr:hypothetical protein [Marinovum sp.]